MSDPTVNLETVAKARRWLTPLRRYHRHRVYGLDNVPREGPALMVINHSLATYDAFMLGIEIAMHTGRVPRGLGDNLIFKTPVIDELASLAGIHPANQENGGELLQSGHLVFVAPGGMREALRPSTERYRVRWTRRKGFARLAYEQQVPVVLIGCPAADDLLTVYENKLTKLAYRHLRAPLPFIRGVGPTILPRPVKLTHHIAPPLTPPALVEEREQAFIEGFHTECITVMEELLSRD